MRISLLEVVDHYLPTSIFPGPQEISLDDKVIRAGCCVMASSHSIHAAALAPIATSYAISHNTHSSMYSPPMSTRGADQP